MVAAKHPLPLLYHSAMPRTLDAILDELDAVAPEARTTAAAAERAARLAPEVVDALLARRLLRLWLPRDLDGDELDLVDALHVFEAASRVDGAFGWTVTIGVGGNLFAAFLDADGAREVFGAPEAVVAGSGAPSGRADVVDGGYRASGRWRFASGAPHATWFTANCVVHADGSPMSAPGGGPLVRAMAFPADAVEVLHSWDVSGLRATSSHDFAVAETFVPARRTFSVFAGPPRVDAPLYRYPFTGIAQLSFAAVGLGVARHAVDAFTTLAAEQRSTAAGGALLRDVPVARLRLTEAEATLASARALLFDAARDTWLTVCAGDAVAPADERRVALASVHAAASAARATELLQSVAGTSVLLMDSDLGRCWRDAHAVTQNALVSAVAPLPGD